MEHSILPNVTVTIFAVCIDSYVVKVSNGHRSQMGNGHLGQAQMADVAAI